MKKIFSVILIGLLFLFLSACGNNSSQNPPLQADNKWETAGAESVSDQAGADNLQLEIERREHVPITENGTMKMSIKEFVSKYEQIIQQIDENIKLLGSGYSSQKITVGFLVNGNVVGVIIPSQADGTSVGGSGSEKNVVAQMEIAILSGDTYQQGVVMPAAIMAIDDTVTYDEALELLNQILESDVGIILHGVSYHWLLIPGSENSHALVVRFSE